MLFLQNTLIDIQNIFLNLEPSIRLNSKTPVDSLIASIIVATHSNQSYTAIRIVDEDPFFYLKSDKLYLKRPIFMNQQFVYVTISAQDMFNPELEFTKYFLIPIEKEEYARILFDNSPILVPSISVNFDLPKETIIGQLSPLDSNKQQNFEFSVLETNKYLDVSKDGKIILKQKLGNEFLKYTNPYLELKVNIKQDPDNVSAKEIWFKIDTSNQQKPPLRYDFDRFNDPVGQYYFNGTSNTRLGQFQVDRNIYPSEKFSLRAEDQKVTLDNDGNLFIPNNLFNELNSTSTIQINVVDSEQNSVVMREIFEIDIPMGFTTNENILASTITKSTVAKLIEESKLECNSDRDCNKNGSGPNVCLLLSSLKSEIHVSSLDIELFYRRLQFASNKDLALLLKYYRIVHGLKSNSNQFIDELAQLKLTMNDFKSIGICLCDSEFTGFRCLIPVINQKPNQCHPESSIPSCNPSTSKCQKDSFNLVSAIQDPLNQLSKYQSYNCECERDSIIGINCELSTQQCSRMTASMIPINKCQLESQFCYPLFNNSASDHICLEKEGPLLKSSLNYLTFDESELSDSLYTNLNIGDPSVLTGIQSFVRDNAFLHFSFNNYNLIPKGPLAILNPSVNMPDVLNSLRNRVNTFTSDLPLSIQEDLTRSRIDKILTETISSLISQGKLTPNQDLDLVDNLYTRLNIQNSKNSFFSNSNWNLFQNNPNLKPLTKASLETLRINSEKINSYLELNRALSLVSSENPYLDLFSFNDKPYNLVKLDILPGIYLEPDGELTIRPTPGVFLKSEYFIDPIIKSRELIFLPGIFNPASGQNCQANSIFIPGIFSHQIDNFDLDFLTPDVNKYLNKFIPMQIPFNINSMLTPFRESLSETVLKLLPNGVPQSFASYVLWTPLDFDPDSTFDLINKNEKFMTSLFSAEGLSQIVNEQKQLNLESFLSTLLISDPSVISQFYSKNFSLNCITNDTNLYPVYRPQGVQFYNVTHPAQNVSVLEFILYDQNGQPVPQNEVNAALVSYCNSFSNKSGGVVMTNKSFKYFGDNIAFSGIGSGLADSQFQKNETRNISSGFTGLTGSNESNLLFVTKRIPAQTQSLVNINQSDSFHGPSRSLSFPNLSQNSFNENHQDIRAISNKGFISNIGSSNFNNTKNLLELKRISNHVDPNTQLSFKLANDNRIFGVNRKIINENKKEPFCQGFLLNWFHESDTSNIFSDTTSSECEIAKICAMPSKRICCYCQKRTVCPESINTRCDDAMLMCDVCFYYCHSKDTLNNCGYGKNQDSGYYIVRNKDRCSNSFGQIIDVVNLQSCESDYQFNKTGGQISSSEVNEYDEISLDTKSGYDCEYKSNVHSMFKNSKVIVVPNTKKDENYYYVEDSD
ncbi:hypothetical protein BpHYR1_042911 [Brachionus plicatilis]|uniref:Uncharacterized protein n=1 Tax=Brachionus plicatilis TaxID=10195 RepID=A0A3M7T537_BRAPC|nr:hypothetical protein BpHYR1_042911 [Brachionus plicatilis]